MASGFDCAAPLRSERLPLAMPDYHIRRMRRRGPRSQSALLRRALPPRCKALPGTCHGKSGHSVPDFNCINSSPKINSNILENEKIDQILCDDQISIYLINIQCLLARLPELNCHLEEYRPHIVCIQETWLDESTEDIKIPGYICCSRRDRHTGSNRGGILTLRRSDFNALVHVSNAEREERSWHFLKVGVDTILLGNWYRPGASSFDGFSSLYDELGKFFNQVSGIILVGDLNIHHQRWLKFSRENTNIGAEMKTLCDFHGLIQMVKEPTRNDYLLDLVITDIGGSVAKVLPKIANHNAVLVKVPKPAVKELEVEREVWMLKKAKWSSIKKN